MEFNTVILTRENGIAVMTLNRPKALNALNAELIEEIGQALEIVAADEDTRVLIVTGGEKAFAAGGDIKAMMECDPRQAKVYVEPIHRVFNRLAEFPKPTIAAISDFALGGGMELAATCDIRIAGDSSSFGFPEIGLGIFPAAGGSQRIPRLIGLARTKELMLTGDIIDVPTALSVGLVNRVVPSTEVMNEAGRLAKKLCGRAPLAMKAVKESIHAGLDSDINTGLKQEIEKVCFLFATDDQKEGMIAFVEKRKADFKGR